MTEWPELDSKYYMQTIVRTPVTLVRGEGVRVWDDQGNEYLDFVNGLAVNCLGHCHPDVVEAVTEQAGTLMQTSLWFYTTPMLRLAELLVENSCLDRVFICNSGLEANEGAVKLARRYGHLHLKGAYEVITTLSSFHGRSLAMTAASGQERMHAPFEPLPLGFVNVANNDIDAIKAATTEKTCAVMLEPIQAEGGVNLADDDYLKKVRDWCDQKGILLILDEIQTGIGRLGALFGYQLYGVEPDIMTLAKGLGGGMPVGALLAKEKAAAFTLGDHNATFGGNPVTSAAAYATLKYVIDHDVAGNARKVGQYLGSGLQSLKNKHKSITDVRGRGLLIAVEFDAEIAQDIVMNCLDNGLLVNRLKPNAIRLIPPLIITNQEVDQALAILDQALSGIGK
ncbi:MAG: aspartate aminotransferase family protein [Dehalococcoidales bacterium]|jgi:acetylornithine/N-succinyldiaminopimelate aminotransferase|nr:aspartate aminotransferase family protein [Dehalococcoidales bacterium]